MEKLSREDENRIISSLERVVGLTNKGTAPNEAIQKIAEEERFGPHVVQRMVEAFNTSKTISHLKHAAGEDRAKSFPIADTASVLENMYPKTVVSPVVKTAMTTVPGELKKAERENFNRILTPSFTFTKVASSIAPDPESAARSCIDELHNLEKWANAASSDYRYAFLKLLGNVEKVATYFSQMPHQPFADVEMNMVGAYGEPGQALMDMVYANIKTLEKRAEAKPQQQLAFNYDHAPYSLLIQMLKEAEQVLTAATNALAFADRLDKFKKEAGFVKEAEPMALSGVLGGDPRPFKKTAISEYISAPLILAGGMSALGLSSPDSEGAKHKAMSEVSDPLHESTLRGANTQSMLNDFLSNDPIISSYQPHEVLSAYNNLSKLAPTVAQQPAVMRGLLRRMLTQENVLEPPEASQIADVESKIRPTETKE